MTEQNFRLVYKFMQILSKFYFLQITKNQKTNKVKNKKMSFINIESLNLEQMYGDFQKAIIDNSTPKNILLFTLGLSTSYIVYKIVGFYLKRRKYRHIPGPPTKGYNLDI